MHDVFSRHGSIEKVHIFRKGGNAQGFCQFRTIDEARGAVYGLNKQCLYDGGANQLTVKGCDRESVSVNGCDEMHWDSKWGVRPGASAGDPTDLGRRRDRDGPAGKGIKGGILGGSHPPPRYDPYPTDRDYRGDRGGYGGDRGRGGDRGGYGPPPQQYPSQAPGTDGSQAHTPVLLFNAIPVVHDTEGNRVVTCDSLFTLAGVFGDVKKVKFLKDPSKALVEMMSVRQAECARVHLDKATLYETSFRVYGANNESIVNPPDAAQDLYDYMDYGRNKLHRFNNIKSYENIASVKATLVIWGFPEGFGDDDVVKIFMNYGTVEGVKAGPKGQQRSMFLVQLESSDQATVCLLNLHNLPVTDAEGATHNIRINYAKSNIHTSAIDEREPDVNVMVKGIPHTYTKEDLHALVAPFGEVRRHTIWEDKECRSKGFGLVAFAVWKFFGTAPLRPPMNGEACTFNFSFYCTV